jgi:hypothetical protein
MSVKVEIESSAQDAVLVAPRAAIDLATDPPRILLRDGGEAEVHLGPCGPLACIVLDGVEDGALLRRRG